MYHIGGRYPISFYQREGFIIQCEDLDEATGEKEYTMLWKQKQKSGLTELKVKNASCLKDKKMGIRKCFLQGDDQVNDQFIQRVIFDWDKIDKDSYLKEIRAFKGVEKLDFNKPITFFVGENGSGKSTLLVRETFCQCPVGAA